MEGELVYYPSPMGNLQCCTKCELVLTRAAMECPVCGAKKKDVT